MKRTIPRLSLAAFVVAGLISLLVTALVSRGTGANQSPQPFGAAPQAWENSNGQPIVGLMPDRSPVLAADGQPLTNSDGTLVTAPFGDAARGVLSQSEADAQFADVVRLQQEDACKRGLTVPVGAEVSGTGLSAEEAAQVARTALEKAVAANGGSKTTSACQK
jgi:hypothetical protein